MEPGGTDLILPEWLETVPGLILGAIPLVASVAIAARRDGPIWLAALVAWVFGWFGLLLVALYYFGPPYRTRSERSESDLEDESISRLRTLNQLLAEGLIDRDEYERKRLEVLERL
jgi:hypothetical protein